MVLRFKIEVTFRTLVHLLGGFSYRFWVKAMTPLPTWPTNLNLADYPDTIQHRILAKVEAFERFINLNAIALGASAGLGTRVPHSCVVSVSPLVSHSPKTWLSQ